MAILVVLLLALAFNMWTAASSVPFVFPTTSSDVYNEPTAAFVHGHTYLPIQVPAAPASARSMRLGAERALTASVTRPVAVQRLLLRFVAPDAGAHPLSDFPNHGREMSESFAVALFAFIGLVCAVALLHLLGAP